MKKLLSLILSVIVLSSYTQTVTFASESDKPWLIYGNDPDEGDIYETYGDTYFLDKCPVKTPSKKMFIILNNETVRNMIAKADAEGYDSLAHIITEDYFPELEIEEMLHNMETPERYELNKNLYLNWGHTLIIKIHLSDYSNKTLKTALTALASRADIDVSEVITFSYNLNDVSSALKYIAGWGEQYWNRNYDFDENSEVDLTDVTHMLKIIAGWKDKSTIDSIGPEWS